MTVGIHKDKYGGFNDFIKKYELILDYNKIDHMRMDINDANFWDDVKKLDLFIYRFGLGPDFEQIAHTIMPIIENELNITCFPNRATSWHFDDKIKEYFLLKAHNIPVIDSFIFFDKKASLEWINEVKFPIIFKLRAGAGSNNVIKLNSKSEAVKITNRIFGSGIKTDAVLSKGSVQFKDFNIYKFFHKKGGDLLRKLRGEDITPYWNLHKNYALFQKYLPNNKYDLRITVIGDKAFAFRRLVRDGDFRASGSGKIDHEPNGINKEAIKLAFKASKKLNFQSMAYDFLLDEKDNPVICEISYTYVDKLIYNCPGYWDSKLNWNEGHFWPQFLHLKDCLKLENLEQPEIYLNPQWNNLFEEFKVKISRA
jgi:glutathione synthase/RimK-type ligase-like ATP-grasp enzyme